VTTGSVCAPIRSLVRVAYQQQVGAGATALTSLFAGITSTIDVT
jgi:hypothetical protein